MQDIKKSEIDNRVSSDNLKPVETNNNCLNSFGQKNFLLGLQNAQNILTNLEQSLEKSSAYEDQLTRCRATHKHSHDLNNWTWDTDLSDDIDFRSSKCDSGFKSDSCRAKDQVNLVDSWSTISIVCLQYQYEELAKRYESLLRAFNDKCNVITAKDATLTRLRKRARIMHAQLASAHRALLCVGEKYLSLKKRKNEQLQQYDKKLHFLKDRMRDAVATVERARLHLDDKLSRSMAVEEDSEFALLLAEVHSLDTVSPCERPRSGILCRRLVFSENYNLGVFKRRVNRHPCYTVDRIVTYHQMRKCNRLFIENLRLKAQLEEFLPGSVDWSTLVR